MSSANGSYRLVRNVDTSKPKQAIIDRIVSMIASLNVRVVAEGIETMAERAFLRNSGIELMQGYLFCKPAFPYDPELNDRLLAGADV